MRNEYVEFMTFELGSVTLEFIDDPRRQAEEVMILICAGGQEIDETMFCFYTDTLPVDKLTIWNQAAYMIAIGELVIDCTCQDKNKCFLLRLVKSTSYFDGQNDLEEGRHEYMVNRIKDMREDIFS